VNVDETHSTKARRLSEAVTAVRALPEYFDQSEEGGFDPLDINSEELELE
jgi:hypothetical protein